jgi:succinate dehydrogenase / fumarate reductase iron-sulfur subunit
VKATLELKDPAGATLALIEAEVAPDATVLDALETAGIGSRVPYRHSCHHGSCGTCGAIVGGVEALMCVAKVADYGEGPISVAPLKAQAEISGIAVRPAPLFASLPASPYLRSAGRGPEGLEAPAELADDWVSPESMRRFEPCIECGICASACPSERPFVGPAALAAWDSWREREPTALESALRAASAHDGVAGCEKAFECSKRCPQGVAPGRRIRALEGLIRKG